MTAECTNQIRVCREDFDVAAEYERLRAVSNNSGAIATFSGLVRELHEDTNIVALTLEHYPGMTEKSLADIAAEAGRRWSLKAVTIIHRVGELLPGDQIVFVGVASAHRQGAFAACEFIMDFLKTRAPFWKKCREADREYWVDARESDDAAAARWQPDQPD